MAGVMVFYGKGQFSTFCQDGTFTIPLHHKLHLQDSGDVGKDLGITVVIYASPLAQLTYRYSVHAPPAEEALYSMHKVCSGCSVKYGQPCGIIQVRNSTVARTYQLLHMYTFHRACIRFRILWGLVLKSVSLLNYKITAHVHTSDTLFPYLYTFKVRMVPIFGKCSELSGVKRKTSITIKLCLHCYNAYLTYIECGESINIKSSASEIIINPGDDWHSVIIYVRGVEVQFTNCLTDLGHEALLPIPPKHHSH